MTHRRPWIYGLLAAAWLLGMGWMAAEHYRVRKSARASLINRAKDISNTLGLVLRSQQHFGGIISKERLESGLNDLVKPDELNAIALLNAAGDVVAFAGVAPDLQAKAASHSPELWEDNTVTLVNLVDLGTNITGGVSGTNRAIILPREDFFRPFETNRPPNQRSRPRPEDSGDTNNAAFTRPPPPPPPPQQNSTNSPRPRGEGRPRFARPFWMSEPEYKAMIEKQGVHSFMIVLSTHPISAIIQQDLWLRSIIGVLATVLVLGSGFAWGNQVRSNELQIRLIRASELNTHLKEMNLAAAGLAHETRNPLNIIRGLAQMISKKDDASDEIRTKSREIIDEVDRVTAQLNEFINYSRPRELRRASVSLNTVSAEVVRTLGWDIEEKNIHLQVLGGQIMIEADEHMLRQTLFNLLLNAIQAVEQGGEIQIVGEKRGAMEAVLEIRDNGPGVPPERRAEIFKPYFTTNQKGTGLGLAVVHQIILAHGWEIQCLANNPRGALFRISHLKIAAAS